MPSNQVRQTCRPRKGGSKREESGQVSGSDPPGKGKGAMEYAAQGPGRCGGQELLPELKELKGLVPTAWYAVIKTVRIG